MKSHLSPRSQLLARIDVMTVCSALSTSVGGASRLDVHLFAYLAAMVNTQVHDFPEDWGYDFSASPQGRPFAEALEYCIEEMLLNNEVLETSDGMILASRSRAFLLAAEDGASFSPRIALLRDVCNVVVYRALPTIGRALENQPAMSRAVALDQVSLIGEDGLREYLAGLMLRVRADLPETFSPSWPAMLWLDLWEGQDA